MGKIKGFLFAVRHREILMTDLGLYNLHSLLLPIILTTIYLLKLLRNTLDIWDMMESGIVVHYIEVATI